MKDASCGFRMQVTIHLRDIEEGADEFNKAWGEVMDPEHLPVILPASSLAPSHWCAEAESKPWLYAAVHGAGLSMESGCSDLHSAVHAGAHDSAGTPDAPRSAGRSDGHCGSQACSGLTSHPLHASSFDLTCKEDVRLGDVDMAAI